MSTLSNASHDHLLQSRTNFNRLIDSLTLEQLNTIPPGYNNNILWNFGHVVVTQQLLCYRLAGQEVNVSEDLINEFRKGTKPSRAYTEADLEELKELSLALPAKFKTDYAAGVFEEYKEYTTSFNVTLASIEDAALFNSVHEGLHLGYAMAMRKLV